MISSASGLIGSSLHPRQFGFEQLGLCVFGVNLSFLFTGSPHSQQCVSSRMTRALILSRVCPLILRGFCLVGLLFIGLCVVFAPGVCLVRGGGCFFGGCPVWFLGGGVHGVGVDDFVAGGGVLVGVVLA